MKVSKKQTAIAVSIVTIGSAALLATGVYTGLLWEGDEGIALIDTSANGRELNGDSGNAMRVPDGLGVEYSDIVNMGG